METPTVPTTEVKKTSKNYYETLDESIAKMKLTFGNASLPEIFAVMVVVGYTAEKIAGLNAELTQLETLAQGQIKEHADQSSEQLKFNTKWDDVNHTFIQHRGLLRILLKKDRHSWVALNLDSEIPKAYAAWLVLVTNFYAQFDANPQLATKAVEVGLNVRAIEAQKNAILEVQNLKQSLRKETADAERATEARNAAFDVLYPKYSDYIQYAKVMLPNNQLLEAIGVKVKAN